MGLRGCCNAETKAHGLLAEQIAQHARERVLLAAHELIQPVAIQRREVTWEPQAQLLHLQLKKTSTRTISMASLHHSASQA